MLIQCFKPKLLSVYNIVFPLFLFNLLVYYHYYYLIFFLFFGFSIPFLFSLFSHCIFFLFCYLCLFNYFNSCLYPCFLSDLFIHSSIFLSVCFSSFNLSTCLFSHLFIFLSNGRPLYAILLQFICLSIDTRSYHIHVFFFFM